MKRRGLSNPLVPRASKEEDDRVDQAPVDSVLHGCMLYLVFCTAEIDVKVSHGESAFQDQLVITWDCQQTLNAFVQEARKHLDNGSAFVVLQSEDLSGFSACHERSD